MSSSCHNSPSDNRAPPSCVDLATLNNSIEAEVNALTSVLDWSKVNCETIFSPDSDVNCSSNECNTLTFSPNLIIPICPTSSWVNAFATNANVSKANETDCESDIDLESSIAMRTWYCRLDGFVRLIQILSFL